MTVPIVSEGVTMRGDALTTPLSLSVLTATRGNASKTLLAGAQGQPIKNAASLAIPAGVVEHVQVPGLAGLRELLRTIQHNQALVHGVVKGSQPGHSAPFVTKDKLALAKPGTLAPGTIARSLDFLAYPDDVFLLMLDRDDNPEDPAPVTTAEALLALLAPLVPGLSAAGALVTNSTSSAIRDKITEEWLLPPTGYHIYMLAQGNLSRFVEALTIRLWNAGLGFCKLATPNAQTGVAAVLERATIDLLVFSPERLDYVAGARIAKHAPFYQDRGEPRLLPGEILDLDTCPDVTPEERQAYETRLAAAKAALAPARFQTVRDAILDAEPERPADQVEELAQQRLEQHDEGYLPDDLLLYFYHRKKAVAVNDLSADYDGKRLADPAEPTYRDGADAIFHWRQGDWLINSFAHGAMRTYRAVPTPPPDPDEEDMQDLLQRAATTRGTPRTNGDTQAPPPDSVLAKAIAHGWQDTMAFDLHRQAFMRYAAAAGIFQELDELEVDAALTTQFEQRLPDGFYTKTLRNVKYLLKSALHTRMASGPSTLVPFTNGVLDVKTGEWQAHSPAFRFTWRLPYAYDPQADCPQTQAWLLEACRGRADQVEALRAFLRAVLCGRNDLQKFLELVGPGGSGKGTMTRLAQGVVGLENVAVTELRYLESNRFETSNLIHKRLIIVTDAEQWGGQLTTLKALTGGDSLRVERKHVQTHPNAVAEGLVIVAANEPVTSGDYTSGLDRRRIPVPFLHKPSAWRNLLEIKGDHFVGELAHEFPGVVNWVLAMPERTMEAYILRTGAVAPTLAESHRRTLVQTNPLAAWADDRLTLDPPPDEPVAPDSRPKGVKIGVAVLDPKTQRYDNEDVWLYPNYTAYCRSTNNKPLSLRRFTNLLIDLLSSQLHLAAVEHKTTKKGAHIFGIRFRCSADDADQSTNRDTYLPKVPFLITGTPPAGAPSPPVGTAMWGEGPGVHPSPGEGSEAGGEGWGEGLDGPGYGSEGSGHDFAHMYTRARTQHNTEHDVPPDVAYTASPARAYRGGRENGKNASLPSLTPFHPSPHPSPIPHPVRDQGSATPSGCPQCHWSVVLDKGTYTTCPRCRWTGNVGGAPPACIHEHVNDAGVCNDCGQPTDIQKEGT